jgi:quercetin dioxygenase-like cupin family protein
VLAVTLAVALAAITVLPSLVRAADPISVELLTSRAQFTDQVDAQIRFSLDGGPTTVLNMPDASRTLVARFTVQPGAQFPWHTHPGPVIVNIAQGELVYVQASDCVERGYPAGTVFIDPGRGNVHSAYNPSDSVPTIVVATFLDFPADGPLTIADANQAHCAMQGGAHAGH